jgi:polyhydroxyalkanoate synthase
MIAAPWHFSEFGARAREEIAALWAEVEPGCAALGLVPMEVLQAGFWPLDPGRTIGKYERFGRLDPDSDEARSFVRLEDWANAGAPLTYAAGAELFGFFENDAPGKSEWRAGGAVADPGALPCPAVDFVSLTDRIVPAASAAEFADRRELGAGHVGMIVGGRAQAQLWEPLDAWLMERG